MRTIEMTVFDYNELSDEAKETAFENWLEQKQRFGYSWEDEVSKILKHIEKNTPIRVEDLQYNTCNFSYYLNVTGYHGKDDDKYHVTGLRAAKIVLAMYYEITHKTQFYVRNRDHKQNAVFGYTDEEYLGHEEKKRRSAFHKYSQCFTGYCDSETFSSALYASVKENTNNDFTVLDHFKIAFDALFSSVVSDYEGTLSEAYFIENEAEEVEYTEDGEIYTGGEE
ncbi:MAG: hypothetical protein J6N72_10390 [Psychrobacter sp.]|nr:hypothetical protein [Psychrobacter sp.]